MHGAPLPRCASGVRALARVLAPRSRSGSALRVFATGGALRYCPLRYVRRPSPAHEDRQAPALLLARPRSAPCPQLALPRFSREQAAGSAPRPHPRHQAPTVSIPCAPLRAGLAAHARTIASLRSARLAVPTFARYSQARYPPRVDRASMPRNLTRAASQLAENRCEGFHRPALALPASGGTLRASLARLRGPRPR